MKIVIFNLKGGQGKTSIAVNLALTLNAGIITNDVYSPLESVLSQNQFIRIEKDEEFPDIDESNSINIYDLGGWIDERAIGLFKEADLIIVPMINSFLDNQTTINTLEEVKKYNDRVIIVVNRTTKNDFAEAKSLMENFYKKDEFVFFEIKQTTAFKKIFEKTKSINSIMEEDKLLAYSYRELQQQFQQIVDFIKNIEE
ncbi:MAG: hypothetical protein LBH46_00520 [Rickettsiales bacterium]|jgi:cellulose biosynthesis protein BcsQ|nr:hypothetical protein [Rickettsiales bacterium]